MTIIVLINLLIAMMSDTYCRIQEQVRCFYLNDNILHQMFSPTSSGSLVWRSWSGTCREPTWLHLLSTSSPPGWCCSGAWPWCSMVLHGRDMFFLMVLLRKRYIEIRAERKKAKMRFRRAMREEIMSKAPGMRWAFKTKDDQTLCWQVCGGREHNEEEEAKEAAGDPRPWEHQVGVCPGKCKKIL